MKISRTWMGGVATFLFCVLAFAADPQGARQRGISDGQSDGAREASARAPSEGEREGREQGVRHGFNECEREAKRIAYDRGYREGFEQGDRDGQYAGSREGESEGSSRGRSEGHADGLHRADQDSNAAATPVGTQKGIDEANHSDADERGTSNGTARGDADALARAQTYDYQRGRKDYRDSRFAEAVETDETWPMNPLAGFETLTKETAKKQNLASILKERSSDFRTSASPDRRYYNPRGSYSTPEENSAYSSGYSGGYDSGFHSNYDSLYRSSFNNAYRRGEEEGCRNARNQNYHWDYRRGYDEGKNDGYTRAYRAAYDIAFRSAYDWAFRNESSSAYQQSYQGYYNQHFEEARAQAYKQRYHDIYEAAYDRAYEKKYNQVYPGYAAREYKRGVKDETQDFAERPVRLLEAAVLETISNGLFEPGEALRLKLQFRNFSGEPIAAKDVHYTITALDQGHAVVTTGTGGLPKDFKRKSVTVLDGVLEFKMLEDAADQTTRFVVSAEYRGKNIGQIELNVLTQFQLQMSFAETPILKEGMESTLKVKVKNISTVAVPAGVKVRFVSATDLLELVRSEAILGGLESGQEGVLEFTAIARTGGTPSLPIVISATLPSDRRIGLVDRSQSFPVENDYTIGLRSDAGALKTAGVIRLEYQLNNVSSRVVFKSLQLRIKVVPKSGDPFAVVGPNPQYLKPLLQGESTRFVVPVLVRTDNEGGRVELEVQESGRTVVIHRAEF